MSVTLDRDLQEIQRLIKSKPENKQSDVATEQSIPQIVDKNITYLSVIIVILVILIVYLIYRVYKVNKDSKMVENIIEHRDKVKKTIKSKIANEIKRQPEAKKLNTEIPHNDDKLGDDDKSGDDKSGDDKSGDEPGDSEEQKHENPIDDNVVPVSPVVESAANTDFTCDINKDDALNMLNSINNLIASN